MEPRRKAQFLQEAARTHRYGPILWLVGPSNFRTRSSPPLSFNCRHICTGRPPQQSLGPLTAGLRATSLRRCRRRQGCPMKSAASRGAPGEGEERGGGERRGPMQLMRASVWLVARLVLPEQRCGVGWTLGPAPLPPAAVGGAAGKARPLVRLVGCCPLKGSLQCGKGERRRGSVWSLSVFSLGIFRLSSFSWSFPWFSL